ncbi:MAG: AIM24 family protein [Pirellulaceae bacterium]
MSRYSIQEFIDKTKQKDRGQGEFEMETERILEINLAGEVWTKMGSMISYRGDVKFVREKILEHGIGQMLKRTVSGEGTRLTKATGSGQIYLADTGKKITILNLNNEAIFVNGNDVLAFETHIDYKVKMMRKMSAMMAGGLFNVRLEGTGMVAFTTHYDPITLMVTPETPVVTDPNATVAWSGNLEPKIKTDLQLKSFFGRGSGESIQTEFTGNGFVVIQPFEEVYFQAG